jgi:DNA-binding NarL/FixJ family response regulator
MTDRELGVLRLLSEGKTKAEIGGALRRALRTVDSRLTRLDVRLDVIVGSAGALQ